MLDGALPAAGSMKPPRKPFSLKRYAFASAAPVLSIGLCVLPLVFSGPSHAPVAAPVAPVAEAQVPAPVDVPIVPAAVAEAPAAAPAPIAAAASITKAAPKKKIVAKKKASRKKTPAKKSAKKTNVARR